MNTDSHIRSATSKATQKWLDELTVELRLRNVTGAAIGDTLASVQEFVADSGQAPLAEFGSAQEYANTLDLPTAPAGETRKAIVRAAFGIVGFIVFNSTIGPWATGGRLDLNLPQLLLMMVPFALVAALPLYLLQGIKNLWPLFLAISVGMASALLAAFLAPKPGEEAWLSLNPTPLLVASIVLLLVVSVIGTISALIGPDERLRDPLEDPATSRRKTALSRTGDVVVQWMFPLAALALWGLTTALRA